ncbi:MAG: hypothetical protein L0I62_02910 [Gammaproteobacteria bacterium]|nr:hypothetical protein [Gammaproteobacteria bacterium]
MFPGKLRIRGCLSGAPFCFIAVIGLLFVGCANSAKLAHTNQKAAYAKFSGGFDYPDLTTGTGMVDFLFWHSMSTSAHWPSQPGTQSQPLQFERVAQGQIDNWQWEIFADKSLVPLYQTYRQSSSLRWATLMNMLRHSAEAVFPSQIPPLHFIIRMAPGDIGYSESCKSDIRKTVTLCYAFPFSLRPGKGYSYWTAGMLYASAYLSHETALALLLLGNVGDSSKQVEALATLFNMIFVLHFGSFDSQFRGFVLPPLRYGLTHSKLNQMGMQRRWYVEGGQIAGLALAGAFGGLRVICGNDQKALQAYRSLLQNLIRNPTRLHKLRAKASRRLYTGIAGTQITVITSAGKKRLPVRLLNHSEEQNEISLGGTGIVLLSRKNGPIKISDRPQRNYRVYLEICPPRTEDKTKMQS